MGKTSLAMNIAEHVAIDQRLPVGVFSLEMTAESLVLRMLCSRSRVNLRNVREGFLAERDFPQADRLGGQAGQRAAVHRRFLRRCPFSSCGPRRAGWPSNTASSFS